jgi:predicted enzyme related to lactoylglutathione lyase
MVTFDSLGARALAGWWAEALGGEIATDHDGQFVTVEVADGVSLGFQHVAETTPGKNKLHLDLTADDPTVQIKRFQELGATVLRRHETQEQSWAVLADPEDNEFCIAAA